MKIFYLNGPNSGISEELFPPTVSIGRESDNDIQLLQANVSRYHARLDYYNGKWTFLDLCSTNGSTINGKKVAHPTVLEEGDIFSVGDQHFCFGFQSQESADQSDDTKYGLPPEQTVHYANHQELQKMLAEKKEAKTVSEFISYRLTAFGILLLILFLLVATILSIRFFVQSRHLNSEIVKAQEQLFMSEVSHFPKIFLYEIQYG